MCISVALNLRIINWHENSEPDVRQRLSKSTSEILILFAIRHNDQTVETSADHTGTADEDQGYA